MNLKLFFSTVLICFLCSQKIFAQAEPNYFSDLTQLSNWISNDDSIIAHVKNRDMLTRTSRQLSYIPETLENILQGQKDLTERIRKNEKANSEKTSDDSVQIQQLVNQIAGDIDQLYDRTKRIGDYVSAADSENIEPIVESFKSISDKRDYIKPNDLRRYLFGQDDEITEKELKKISDTLTEKVNAMLEKMKTKLNK